FKTKCGPGKQERDKQRTEARSLLQSYPFSQIEEVDVAMEWDFAWESTELEPKEDDHFASLVDFTSSDTDSALGTLKLSMADPKEQSLNKPNDTRGSILVPSPSGSSKKLNGIQKLSCLVDGCKADLSSCREYHRRHRVCEHHSKTPIVNIKGEEKRFCQQCSRFHSLGEFDEVKRSCRKRLDGHNRRRRKSQPEPFYLSSKNFLANYKGPRMLHFGKPHLYATASVKNMWPFETKSAGEPWIYRSHERLPVNNEQHSPNSSFNGGDNGLFFLEKNDPKLGSSKTNPEEAFVYQPLAGSQRFPSEEVSLPLDSGGRALYLLSTHPTQVSAENHLSQPNETCSFQLLDFNVKEKPLDPYPGYDPNKTNIQMLRMEMGPDCLLEYGALQVLPISLE
ncbi:hypothetical protein UlMin_013832, partial [Ulmus minor]